VSAIFGAFVLFGLAGALALVLRQEFIGRLEKICLTLQQPHQPQGARTDLPPEVIALGERLGARGDVVQPFVQLEQCGEMWKASGEKPMSFTALQTIRSEKSEFLWRATMDMALVADFLVGNFGGLEGRIMGVIPLVKLVGGDGIHQGQLLRYLAELPWNPDAILCNRDLEWTVLSSKSIRVAAGIGAARGEITFELGGDGYIATASAVSRLCAENGQLVPRPWHGRFWDYQLIGDRMLPRQAEVAWTLDAGEFVYWRGRLLTWSNFFGRRISFGAH
jgi:hypothetical protein